MRFRYGLLGRVLHPPDAILTVEETPPHRADVVEELE